MAAQSFPLATGVPVPRSHWDGSLAVDLFAPCGTSWLAVCDGQAQPLDVPAGGNALLLQCASGETAYYAHGLPGRASGAVQAGQHIGAVSDSGNAQGRGCHLHFAVGSIDDNGAGDLAPWDWLAGASPSALGLQSLGRVPWRLLALAAAALLVLRRL